MNVKEFVLSHYKNATENFYIEKLSHPTEAQKLHKHPYFQVYYMLKGKIEHFVKNGKATLIVGDVFIVPPSVPHYINVSEKNSEFYTMSFMPEFIPVNTDHKFVNDFLYHLTHLSQGKIQPKLSIPHSDQLFCQTLFTRISEEFARNDTGKEDIIRACVLTLTSIFARFYFEQKHESIGFEFNRSSVYSCLEYVKKHPYQNFSLTDVAKASAMSKSNFCKVFHSVSGKSFMDFVHDCRIEKAKELINKGEKFSTVCRACGYNDFSTFYRNFKKYTGISPTEFKNNNA